MRRSAEPAKRPDRWPFAYNAWVDPPWTMTGSRITAWIRLPYALLARIVSPDLLPAESVDVEARLRFYTVTFQGVGRPGVDAPGSGQFREAVIAFPAQANGLLGQVSTFMWTDSDPYLLWGREVFGWPLERGDLDMDPIAEFSEAGQRPFASVRTTAGEAAMTVSSLRRSSERSRPEAPWLTPRRVLQRGGLDGETREVFIVRSTVRTAGRRYSGAGTVRFAFDSGHVLHDAPTESFAAIEADEDFEIVVGDRVELAC